MRTPHWLRQASTGGVQRSTAMIRIETRPRRPCRRSPARPRTAGLLEDQERGDFVLFEIEDRANTLTQQLDDRRGRAVATLDPDDLRWEPLDQTALVEITVLRDDQEPVFACVIPDPSSGARCSATARTCTESGYKSASAAESRGDRLLSNRSFTPEP